MLPLLNLEGKGKEAQNPKRSRDEEKTKRMFISNFSLVSAEKKEGRETTVYLVVKNSCNNSGSRSALFQQTERILRRVGK